MNFVSEDIELIKKLLANSHVNLYDLHVEFQLSPAQVVTAIDKLRSNAFVTMNGMSITLTKKGKEWLNKNAGTILTSKRNQYWKELSIDMLQPQIGVNTFYKPNIDKIRKEGKIISTIDKK